MKDKHLVALAELFTYLGDIDMVREYAFFDMSKWSVVQNYVPSSNVKRAAYNTLNQMLVLEFREGGYYTYFDVPSYVFWQLMNKAALATTDGENQWGSWYVGKPSVGAGVWQFLRDKYAYVKGQYIS
jgi:hypothetical protein